MALEFTQQDEYQILTLKGDCNGAERPTVDAQFESRLKGNGIKYLVVQCEACGDMNTQFLRGLAQIYKKLKELNGKICLINVNDSIREAIKRNGLDRLLPVRTSLRAALVEFGLAKQKEFDVNFINPFVTATQKVLNVQCSIATTPQKPFLKKPTDPMLLGDLSGIIGITSETFNGTLAISFPEKIFLKLASGMLGQTYTAITPEIVDLAGELSNIILGQSKIELNTLGYKIQQAIPSCVWGKDHQIKHFGAGACIVIPFETADGVFHIEIISNNTSGAKLT